MVRAPFSVLQQGHHLTNLQLSSVQRGVVDTQLIAHDKEVYDIAWGGVGVFASVSADGSVRVFDLRYDSGWMTILVMTLAARNPWGNKGARMEWLFGCILRLDWKCEE